MYLNLAQIAESFGVSERVVAGWMRDEGLPHTLDRGRPLFDRAQVAQWAMTRGLAAKAGFLAPPVASLSTQLHLGALLRAGGIWRDVAPAEVSDVFVRVATALPGMGAPVRALLEQRLRAPGGVSMAPIGAGYALPHPAARFALGRDAGALAILLLREALAPVEPRVDDVPVTRLVFVLAPSPRTHLELIARVSRLLVRGPLGPLLEGGATDEAILGAVDAADAAGAQATSTGGRR